MRMGVMSWLVLAGLCAGAGVSAAAEHVVVLHGLARSTRAMAPMAAFLAARGYVVTNIAYPSRAAPVESLAVGLRAQLVAAVGETARVHVVAHSMGGILIRQIQATHPLPNLGRVVMLGPPNVGSEVVDRLGGLALFRWINGPAGLQLGTVGAAALPARLGPVTFEVGVLAGDRSINWINSLMIPGPDDGKVSVARARVEGERAFRVVHVAHPFLMRDAAIMHYALRFLQHGQFEAPPAPHGL